MSKYTTQLRWPIEQKLTDLKLENVEQNWPKVYGYLGLDDYPIYDEAHRSVLNNMIIRRYYFREIGFETMAQFTWMLRRTMHEIMPWYNDLYRALELVKNPLSSRDMNYEESWDIKTTNDVVQKDNNTERNTGTVQTDTDATVTGTTTNDVEVTASGTVDSDGTTSNRNVFQDTPMNQLDSGGIRALDYATTVTYDDGTTHDETDSTSHTVTDQDGTSRNVTDESVLRTDNTQRTRTSNDVTDQDGTDKGWRVHREWGYDIPLPDLLKKYKDNFINIDLEITERLNDLFMGLW